MVISRADMKKFLSIKNSQGIYVARASFSSDETVIDFVNNKSTDNNCNSNPVSIITKFAPDQLVAVTSATTSTSEQAIIESGYDTRSVRSESLFVTKSPSISSKKKRFTKVLTLLHLKKKSRKMSEHSNEDASTKKSPGDIPSTSVSFPMLPTPKSVRKGRTAALVKKYSLTPKKSPPKELSLKKSSIPLRTSTSVETISNAPQMALQNRIETKANVSQHSMSEMNLVNIDYCQESSDNVGGKVGQTQFRSIRSGVVSGSVSAESGASSNLSRAWNASSNLSIKSGVSQASNGNNKMGTGGRKSTSTEKLQITISGKKRINTTDSALELQRKEQPSTEIESKKFERKPLTIQHQQQQQQKQHQPPKKLNINHDLTLMNTVGVPPAPTTQAPSAIPSCRGATTTAASIKNVVQRNATIKAQSTMQSQQSVDTSASGANVGQQTTASKQRAELLTITSFDVEEPEEIAAASKVVIQEKDSLLTEIIEAERRNSLSMDVPELARGRGRGFSSIATSGTIKFAHQSTSSSDTSSQPTPQQPEIIPKVIIEDITPLQRETFTSELENESKTDGKTTAIDIVDKDKELLHTLTQSSGAKVLQPYEGNESQSSSSASAQPLQFEVGKQVRPIFPSNQNLHHNTYSALDNDPATAYTSIITTSSYIDTHNSNSLIHVHGDEPLSAPSVNVKDKDELISDDHELNQTRSQQQKNRGRRRIAYLEQSQSNKSPAGSPSTSNSTINTEDDDILPENRPDSLLTSQFDDDLHTSSTFITDFVMPPYGDLVWDDDGVIERIKPIVNFI